MKLLSHTKLRRLASFIAGFIGAIAISFGFSISFPATAVSQVYTPATDLLTTPLSNVATTPTTLQSTFAEVATSHLEPNFYQ